MQEDIHIYRQGGNKKMNNDQLINFFHYFTFYYDRYTSNFMYNIYYIKIKKVISIKTRIKIKVKIKIRHR